MDENEKKIEEEKRLNLFFSLLDKNQEKFKDIFIDNIKFAVPIRSSCSRRRYKNYMVKAPLRFFTTKRYIVKLNDYYYQLYRLKDTISFVRVMEPKSISDMDILNFYNSIQFSYIFYLLTKILEEIIESGKKVNVVDTVFRNLTEKYSTEDGTQDTIVYVTVRPEKSIKTGNNIIKLSIFN